MFIFVVLIEEYSFRIIVLNSEWNEFLSLVFLRSHTEYTVFIFRTNCVKKCVKFIRIILFEFIENRLLHFET